VVGNVDAGKSTLLGVLTHGELDNGRGLSRQKLFRHQHEADSGRTSSVSHDIIGFGADGTIVNKPGHDGNLDWPQICNDAAKVVTFTDLAGHEKYLKTTVFGLTGHSPAFVMLMIGANAGVIGMTKEHLGLALALQKPVFVVVTKIDMCPPNVLASTLKLLNKILKSAGVRKLPMMINSADDVVDASKNFLSQRLCPIFQVSNVTGQNHDILKMFLNLLRPTTPVNPDKPAEFQIDDTFSVPGVGTVVSGTAVCGTIKVGESLLLGPDSTGEFQSVVIKGIHRRRMPTTEVRGGQAASFALKKIKRAAIRKGMVLIHASANPVAYWEFDAEILILHHPSTIATKYQAMVHVGSVRQTAAILKIVDKDHLRTGDKAICRLRFVRFPECIREGVRIVFREGRTKAIGTIARVVPAEEELLSGADYSNISRRVKSSETTAARLVRAAQEAANPAPAVVTVA
jgi:GTPase